MEEDKEKCECPSEEEHPCPYKIEINDDSKSICNCCKLHTQECADNI